MRTPFLTLLLTPLSTGHILSPSDIEAPQHPALEKGSHQLPPADTKLPSLNKPQLSPSDERTLQREFLLQQFIHRLTTTPHQTILRTQVSWEAAGTLQHLFHKTAQTRHFLNPQICVLQDPDPAGILGDHRPRRSTFAPPPFNSCSKVEVEGEEQQQCCVDSVIVDFAALGWHFVLSPPTLEFTYCRHATFTKTKVHRFSL